MHRDCCQQLYNTCDFDLHHIAWPGSSYILFMTCIKMEDRLANFVGIFGTFCNDKIREIYYVLQNEQLVHTDLFARF